MSKPQAELGKEVIANHDRAGVEAGAPAEGAQASPAHLRRRDPREQRQIIRQTAIKCSVDLVASGKVDVERLFQYAGRIVAWIYSTGPQDG